jgi:high affinity Mn2+ porin
LTLIEQGYFRFRSPYAGENSLSGGTQFRNTASATAFLGMRLWRGAELYVNPELDQGFGLSQTLGIAGFPNGEAQKAAYPVPRVNVDRLFLRQTFGLSGARTTVADGPNRLASTYDVSRVTVTVGRLSVGDVFCLNAYASDPRTQFMNWNVYGGGSYDWTMDRPGWTWGAIVELSDAAWALRAGYFLEPTVSNGNSFDMTVPPTVSTSSSRSFVTRCSRSREGSASSAGCRAPTWEAMPTPSRSRGAARAPPISRARGAFA